MNISFDLYKIFYYVATFKSVTKTANFLYVSQPAITKHIKNLESYLGKTLIERTPTGIELTKEGLSLYNEIKEPIERLNLVEAKFKNNSYEQEIRIIAGVSTIKKLLLETLSEFNKEHPNIKFELSTYHYAESIQRLREGKADLIFLSFHEKEEDYEEIKFEKWLTLNDALIVSSEIADKFPNKINIEDINNYPIISTIRNSFYKHCEKNGILFKPKYELSNNWLVEEYVKMNMGIGILSKEFIADELNNNKFKEIECDPNLLTRETGYAYRKDSNNLYILKEIIESMTKNIKR